MASQSFGKYVASELLGSGGMAEVYAALHPDLARKVAIKVILPQFAAESNFEERFRREARMVASLRHAHIVQIYDFDVVDGRYFMVMEYLEGGTLKEYLRGLQRQNARMAPVEIATFAEAIAAALDYAHQRGAVHRDVKPANILFTPERQPVLTDFGIAKLLEDAARLTATGGVLGSPFYMAPEQATGGEVGAASDQYALGVMLFEMATGRLPFVGTSAVAVMTQHCNSAPPAPRSLNAALPEAMQTVLLRTLAKRPGDRFGSAGEMAAALRQAVGVESIAPISSPAVSRAAVTSSAAADATLNADDKTVTDERTVAHARTQVDAIPMVGADAATTQPASDTATVMAISAALAPTSEAHTIEAVPVEAKQPLARLDAAPLAPADEKAAVDEKPAAPVPPAPAPKPTTQNFQVGGIQAGIVNQGGEQTFSGNLSFNLNFGDVNTSPPPSQNDAAQNEAQPAAAGDAPDLAALLDALRAAFGASNRVDRFTRLVTQFHTQLDALPPERADDRKQVIKRVQALLMEITEAKPDADMVEIMGTSLTRAVQPLAVVDPDLPTLATRITSWVELIIEPE